MVNVDILQVLSAARNAARDLEILQEAYVSSFLKQRCV
jgi:hypothetical protein